MALETGSFVSDLVDTNPTSGDPKAQGDDHLRLIKQTLQATLPEGSAPIYGLRSATLQATTSGTSIDFTSIPSWAKRIVVQFVGVSTNGTDNILIQLGDAGGVEATGYLGCGGDGLNGGGLSIAQSTTGFLVAMGAATNVMHGSVELTLQNAATFTWVASGVTSRSDVARIGWTAGSKSLSAALDRVRITTTAGANTFDAGSVNILYE